MKEKLGLNPWLRIWTHPRKTIRALVQYNTHYRMVALCAIYGFQYILQMIQYLSLGKGVPLIFIILLALIFSVPVGYIIFNVLSACYCWTGKLIKGRGNFKQIRAATYWSSVPLIVTCLIWVVLVGLHGNSLFVPSYETKDGGLSAGLSMGLGIVQLGMGIWGLIILLHTLGEVQGFSIWMALLNLVLAGIVIFVFLLLIIWGVLPLIHAT